MYTLEIVKQRMDFLARRMEDGKEFLMSPERYSPNNYKFINCILHIKKFESEEYVTADIPLNDLVDHKQFKMYVYE